MGLIREEQTEKSKARDKNGQAVSLREQLARRISARGRERR